MLPEYSIEGKRVLLTGAGRGIGKGIALVMAEAGAKVAVTGLTALGIGSVADSITRMGGKCLPIVADATKEEDMMRIAPEVITGLGGLDAIINCVGDAISAPVAPLPDRNEKAMDQKEWQRLLDINLTEAFLGCHVFGPHLIAQRKGSVINISSFASLRSRALRSAYDTSKAGLVQFGSSLALEWAPYGVRVNTISPGSFPDPDQMTPADFEERQKGAAKTIPLGRVGYLREVGLLALYLASDASAYVTGQNFVIDGGMTIA